MVERRGRLLCVLIFLAGGSLAAQEKPFGYNGAGYAGLLGAGFAEGITSAGAFGGGVNYWFSRRVALRAEFRATGFAAGEEMLAMFRIGLSFR